jgi:DNA-binding response OmpR family regulator
MTPMSQPGKRSQLRVLIADDDEQYRLMLQRSLERAGFVVTSADNGMTAIAAAMHAEHALAVIDLLMPEKEGLETIRELRALRPAMPLIAISGGGRGDPANYLRAARLLGATAALAKPFSIQDLLRTVRETLPAGTEIQN